VAALGHFAMSAFDPLATVFRRPTWRKVSSRKLSDTRYELTVTRMRPWMPRAFLVWSVAALLLGAFFLLMIPAELVLGGKSAGAAFVLGGA
jgi:hypothetical protein